MAQLPVHVGVLGLSGVYRYNVAPESVTRMLPKLPRVMASTGDVCWLEGCGLGADDVLSTEAEELVALLAV